MFNSKQKITRSLMIAVLGSVIAACGGGGGGDDDDGTSTPPPPPVVVAKPEDAFGMAFGTAFRADPNSEPYSPGEEDIIPICLTCEPIEIL